MNGSPSASIDVGAPRGEGASLVREQIGSAHWALWAADLAFRGVPAFVASRMRTQALRAAGVRIGRASVFWGRPTLVGTGDVASRLTIGGDTGFNEGCFFDLEDSITIGNHVAVGHNVMFLTRTHAPGGADRRAGPTVRAPIVVEDGAWLGARCIILPGVRVGAGAVIAASVTVAQDVPPNTLLNGAQKVSLAKWR